MRQQLISELALQINTVKGSYLSTLSRNKQLVIYLDIKARYNLEKYKE